MKAASLLIVGFVAGVLAGPIAEEQEETKTVTYYTGEKIPGFAYGFNEFMADCLRSRLEECVELVFRDYKCCVKKFEFMNDVIQNSSPENQDTTPEYYNSSEESDDWNEKDYDLFNKYFTKEKISEEDNVSEETEVSEDIETRIRRSIENSAEYSAEMTVEGDIAKCLTQLGTSLVGCLVYEETEESGETIDIGCILKAFTSFVSCLTSKECEQDSLPEF